MWPLVLKEPEAPYARLEMEYIKQRLSPATRIINPATGSDSFGVFPEIARPEVYFSGGPIYLRYGRHHGPQRGWGLEHIWQARFPLCKDISEAKILVTQLVNGILISGASIHYEFVGMGSAAQRSSVFRSHTGVVVVEERQDGKNAVFYNIVTAIATPKVNGPKIGAI